MQRSRTALFAVLVGLASVLGAQGSQAADAHGAEASVLSAVSSSDRATAAGSRNSKNLAHRFVPASTPATDPVAARWRSTVSRRLAALAQDHRLRSEPKQTAESEAEQTALVAQLDRMTAHARQVADVGIAVRRLDTGAPVFSYHADQGLNPASNHKLLTAIAAVELLGADYRFSTDVRVQGDRLVLVGDGDPSLQFEDLQALAAQTIASGVDLTKIRSIVADDSAFSARRFGPGYSEDGPGWSYLAPSGALSLQFNTVTVAVRRGTATSAPKVTVNPPCAHVVVDNLAQAGRRTRISVQTYARGTTTVVEVRGTLAANSTVSERRRISDPARFAASSFATALATLTSRAPLPVVMGAAPAEAKTIARHDSAPLPEVLSAALVFSNNFTSEQVLRTLGRRMSGAPGDWENGHVALDRFWLAIGRDQRELTFENASGYSRQGRLTADAIVALLSVTQRAGAASETLVNILPAAGRTGTIRHRMARSRGRVRAKTGTLAGANALSGLVVSRDGRRALGFSILVNGTMPHHSSRRLQDRIVMALVDHLD